MNRQLIADAVCDNKGDAEATIWDRLYAFWLGRLVYTQIWEDPEVDLRALALRPRYADAHKNLGNLLGAAQRFPEAAAHMAAALEINPASVGTLIARAQRAFRKEYVNRYGEQANER